MASPSRSDLFGLSASPWQATAWWCLWLPGAWELARLAAAVFGLATLLAMLTSLASTFSLLSWVGWIARLWPLSPVPETLANKADSRVPRAVLVAASLYVLTFFALNVRLWQNLWIPHGDSAMYEEHLWNLLHGKGFRSYLDNGRLFLGEHVQVIHLLLAPVYVVWPHHLLLEFAQSAALAATAIPVFFIAFRHTAIAPPRHSWPARRSRIPHCSSSTSPSTSRPSGPTPSRFASAVRARRLRARARAGVRRVGFPRPLVPGRHRPRTRAVGVVDRVRRLVLPILDGDGPGASQ